MMWLSRSDLLTESAVMINRQDSDVQEEKSHDFLTCSDVQRSVASDFQQFYLEIRRSYADGEDYSRMKGEHSGFLV